MKFSEDRHFSILSGDTLTGALATARPFARRAIRRIDGEAPAL
jgi:hypothetical protein